MPEIRFRFEKRGRAAYLSHLDVMRTFQRAMIRAGVRVRHSEGFNPHPKMSIALPLQLGCESVCEVLDVSVLEAPEAVIPALNAALPEGIRILASGPVGAPVREIAWTEWELLFPEEAAAAEAERILRLSSLPVEKKTKRGIGTLDIAPHIRDLKREENRLRLRLCADSPTINTGDVRKALEANFGEEICMRALRLRFLKENMESFE